MKTYILILLYCFSLKFAAAQTEGQDSIDDDFFALITLDSFVVTASRSGLDVEDFVNKIQQDKSFYQAFKNLRFKSHSFDSEIYFYTKKGKEKAFYKNSAKQNVDEKACRTMEVLSEEDSGKYFKRKRKVRYYTSKLYERLFFTKGTICESSTSPDYNWDEEKGGMEGYITQLKKLIFAPGEAVDVPMMGDKMEIFGSKMRQYYDYSLTFDGNINGLEAYVFSVSVKPEYAHKNKKVVVRTLKTYFQKDNFQVLGRDYKLAYNNGLFNFDVNMHIELDFENDKYFPKVVSYDGRWDVPLKKPEIAKFSMQVK